jgi:hypothetical protein
MASVFNLQKGSSTKQEIVHGLDDDFHHIKQVISAPEAQQAVANPPTNYPCLSPPFSIFHLLVN